MRHLHALLGFAPLALAADMSYVTDLEIFHLLAPCAASAVSWAVNVQTASSCEDSVTKLQECICADKARSTAVASSIASDLTGSCGPSATEDLQSASRVLDKYCHPDATITFATPTENIVNAYITDLAEMQYLPPCASAALSEAVMGQTNYRCPEAASLFAPCICSKRDAVDRVQETLTSSVKYSCSNTEDVTAARNFYSEYCDMNNGTTSFAKPAGPPGDMTYHITALTQFKSLNSCAQSGVISAVLQQSSSFCGSGPRALASCVCIKSGMSSRVSSSLTSNVKYYCDNTATQHVSSALEVLEYYCSAAENVVVATVTESIAEGYPAAQSGSGESVGPVSTGLSAEDAAGGSQEDKASSMEAGTSVGLGTGAIVGIVVTLLAIAVAVIVYIIWCIRRRKRKANAAVVSQEYTGTPELVGSNTNKSQADMGKMFSPGLGNSQVSELPPQQGYRTELEAEGGNVGYGMPYGQPVQEMDVQSERWQGRPVDVYEMDAGHHRRNL